MVNPSQAVSISVVVLTRDPLRRLPEFVASLERQTRLPHEILVVDAGRKTSPKRHPLPTDRVPVIQLSIAPERRWSLAADFGWRAASGSHVLFLHDDQSIDARHLESLAKAAEAEPDAVVHTGYRITSEVRSITPWPAQSLVREVRDTLSADRLFFTSDLPFAAVLVPRIKLIEIDGLDTTLEAYEDWDLWIRLARRTAFRSVDAITATQQIVDRNRLTTRRRAVDRMRWLTVWEKHAATIPSEAWSLGSGHVSHWLRDAYRELQQLEARLVWRDRPGPWCLVHQARKFGQSVLKRITHLRRSWRSGPHPTMCRAGERPKIAIFGQYKTGTTGLFTKIRNSLPYRPRCLFEEASYIPQAEDRRIGVLAKVMLGYSRTGGEIAQYESFRGFDRQVYLVRDPRDWIVSGALDTIQREAAAEPDPRRQHAILRVLRAKEQEPTQLSLLQVLREIYGADGEARIDELAAWIVEQHAWLTAFEQRLGSYVAVRYEDFVDDRLASLEDYLGTKLEGSADSDDPQRRVARTRSHGDWKNWLLPEDVGFFRPLFDGYIRRHGYSAHWETHANPVIAAEHCSLYVSRSLGLRSAA
jgi:hypothetical protein